MLTRFERIWKKILLISIFALLFIINADAQQTPIYSQFFLNPYLFNPASAGETGQTNAFFLYRNQWAGVEGSPETQVLSIDGRLKNEQLGLGFTFFNDVTNIIGRTNASLTGAYRFKIAEDQQVAFGMSLQLIQNRIYFDRIVADDIDDPNLLNTVNQQVVSDANFGFKYQWKRFDLGFAVDQLFQNEVNFENASQFQSIDYNYIRHYITTLSYNHKISDRFDLKPILLLRLAEGRSPQYDANVLLTYDKKLWLSAAYRHEIGIGSSVGFKFDDQFTVGYAYEFPSSDLSVLGTATHEFIFGVNLSKSRGRKTVSESSFKRRDVKAIQEENQEQFEKISQLEQERGLRENELKQTESLIDRQQLEILKLKQTILELQGDIDELKENSQFVYSEEKQLNEKTKYYLVIGAFREFENAKSYQKIIKREGGVDTNVIQNNRKSWYLIYTEEVKEFDNIDVKLKAFDDGPLAELIVGKPWIFEKNAN